MRDVNKGGLTSSDALETRRKRWLYHEIDDGRKRRDKTGVRFVKKIVLFMGRDVITSLGMLEVSLSVGNRNGVPSRKGYVVNRRTTKGRSNH